MNSLVNCSNGAIDTENIKNLIYENRQFIFKSQRNIKIKQMEIKRLEATLFKTCHHIWVNDLEDRCSRCSICSRCDLPNLPHMYS